MIKETHIGLTIGLSIFSVLYLVSLSGNIAFILLMPALIFTTYFISQKASASLCLFFLTTSLLFQWAIMRITFDFHDSYAITKNVIFSKGILFYIFILLFVSPIAFNNNKHIFTFTSFSFLVFISLLRSPNLSAGILYVLNTWLPVIVLLLWCSVSYERKTKSVLHYTENIRYIFKISISLYIFFWFINFDQTISWELSPFINFHRTGDVDEFFIGNTTKIFGSTFYRNASIIMDPIVAGYFFSQFSFLLLVLRKRVLGTLLFILMILTLSKGAFLLFCLSVFFYYSYRYLTLRLNLTAIFLITGLLIIIALNSAGKNSSYIHALGLIYPFISPMDLNYFIGHNISTGGGLTGTGSLGLQGGMESLVGTLKYQMGLLGVLLYFVLFYKVLRSKFRSGDPISRVEFSILAGSFINSFLQENAFNLPFTMIKIFGFLYLIRLLNDQRSSKRNGAQHAFT